MIKKIGIIGCGPAGLFMLKSLLDAGNTEISITFFDTQSSFGRGMPYSSEGANQEHVTNVSGNEIPDLRTTLVDWVKHNASELNRQYHGIADSITDYKVVPRLVFGDYLHSQFGNLLDVAQKNGISTAMHLSTTVTDIVVVGETSKVRINFGHNDAIEVDYVVICSGHTWPLVNEGHVPGFYDSPYPPAKLAKTFNHEIAITGSSLTAFDALRTLTRANGKFVRDEEDVLKFIKNEKSPDFNLTLYSIDALLPAIRFHLSDPHLSKTNILSKKEVNEHRRNNGGFVSLDYIFEMDFKEAIRRKDNEFYEGIRDFDLETFVNTMMAMREKSDPFQFFKAEYKEALQSIEERKSVYWKEALAILSFAMNYPAKYFSAEDFLRLQKVLMPLISIIIAFVPQQTCEELIALYDAGILSLIACGENTSVTPLREGGVAYSYTNQENRIIKKTYQTFINCTGQRHLNAEDFPFKSLVESKVVNKARLRFRDGLEAKRHKARRAGDLYNNGDTYYLDVPGIAINDAFQPLDENGMANKRISIMAVPFIGGFNPDYSGLDFCEEASKIIVSEIFRISP